MIQGTAIFEVREEELVYNVKQFWADRFGSLEKRFLRMDGD